MKRMTGAFKTSLIGLMLIIILSACGPGAGNLIPTAAPTEVPATENGSEPASGADSAQAASGITKLNLNTSTSDDFLTIPGVGNRMVREFLEYRPYTSIAQFRREIGKYVDDTQVAEYEKYVYVPISAGEADLATLVQIPGLDETEAQALIDARPFASNEAFLEQLTQYVSAAELEIAKTYLSAQ